MVIVEIDGKDYHSSPEKQRKDKSRQEFLESLDFAVIRFTGTQVHNKAWLCCLQVKRLIEERIN